MSHSSMLVRNPVQVRTSRKNWYLHTDGLYYIAGNSKIFGKDIKPCTLRDLVQRHGAVEIVA